MDLARVAAGTALGTDLRLSGIKKAYSKVPAVRGISLDVPAGEMVSLIGPSGCGKTTTLRMIAGLERADEGTITAGDRTLTEGPKSVAPEARNMGMVFQSYALWPHMTVAANVAYGLIRRKRPRDEIAGKVRAVLDLVGMGKFAERYPGQLSGGQQQRVALARSIANEPGILLFDEPLSNLDAVLREQMRFEIRSLQQRLGITGVYVTHSQDEALVLSDKIAVMRDGLIVQLGAPLDVYNVPRTAFVAGFIGLANILSLAEARRSGDAVAGCLANGARVVAACGAVAQDAASPDISIRPADIRLAKGGSDRLTGNGVINELQGVLQNVSFTGALVDYFVRLRGAADLVIRVQSTPPILCEAGDEVTLRFPSNRTVVLES
ncbi:MAG: ABC transporter ATP-binding protein [Betaproteobacteria bacterium]